MTDNSNALQRSSYGKARLSVCLRAGRAVSVEDEKTAHFVQPSMLYTYGIRPWAEGAAGVLEGIAHRPGLGKARKGKATVRAMTDDDFSEQIREVRDAIGSDISTAISDADCVRFIVARKRNTKDAVTMLTNWWNWFNCPFPDQTSKVIPAAGLTVENLEDAQETIYTEYCPHLQHGFDRNGCPIYWEKTGRISRHLGLLKQSVGMDGLLLRHLRMQTLLQLRLRYISEQRGISVEKFVVVFDLQDVKKLPDIFGVKYLKRVLSMDQDYYPERLANIIIINAPSFFASLYKLVSSFVDPVTAQKIRVFDHNYRENLLHHIDDSNIPPEYGGQAEPRDWCWPYAESSGVSPEQLRVFVEQKAGGGVAVAAEGESSRAIDPGEVAISEGSETVSDGILSTTQP